MSLHWMQKLAKSAPVGLGKTAASRTEQYIRALSGQRQYDALARLHRLAGVRPPSIHPDDLTPEKVTGILHWLRALGKVPDNSGVQRGSPLWRSAMQDIKAGRVHTFESGLGEAAGHEILRHGPSSPAGLPLKENMPAVRELIADRADDALDSVRGLKSGDYSVRRAVLAKRDSGLYANDAGTSRTWDYARRASGYGDGRPAALRFELPQSLAAAGSGTELRLPHDFFKRWARSPRLEARDGTVLARGGPNLPDSTKTAEAAPSGADGRFSQDGHWRKLPPGHKGRGPQGQPQMGKTWVRRGRMKEGMKPMPHQADFTKAVKQRLGKKGGGGIIAAHGTGTGKTFSAINAFEELKDEGKASRALVLVPAGLRDNFLKKGIEKFTDSKGVILTKPAAVDKKTEYVVVSYAAFRQNPNKWLELVKPDTIIADEVHRAANPGGKTYQALRMAREQVPRFMGLTASVVQNKPSELVPLVDLATAGEHGLESQRTFKKRHIKRVPTQRKGIFGGKQYEQRLVNQARLNASVGGTVHYIEDLDASKKPTKEVETVEVKMNSDQLKLYRLSMRGVDPVVAKKIQEGKPVSQREAMNVFMKLMRARQVSNSLHLATPNMSLAQAAEQTPKIKKILDDAVEHIKKTPDAQVIMYTNMVHGGVDVLKAGLEARGVTFGIFAGKGVEGVTDETRQKAVDDYLAGKNKVIIITGAGAEGLSLGNTTMVQMVDGHYNPERISQAEARGVRAGGLSHRPPEERKVKVKRYVTTLPKTFWQTITFQQPKKSVGQWVYLTADRKRKLNRELRDVLKKRSEHEQRKRDSVMYRWFGGGP